MTREELMQKIEELLPSSTVSEYHKMMIKAFLPSLDEAKLTNIYKSLTLEREKMNQLAEKKNRIVMKYKVMIEGLAKTAEKK